MQDTGKKLKQKSFLAPFKTKDGAKLEAENQEMPTTAPFIQKKAKKTKLVKDENNACDQKSVNMQKHATSDLTVQNKTDQDNLKADPKRAKKSIPTAPAKSLSDAEYESLFSAVLQRVMGSKGEKEEDTAAVSKDLNPMNDGGSGNDEDEPKESTRNISRGSCDNDLDSISSDDVDTWTDSPPRGETQENRDPQAPFKSKSVANKKAERSGILKPKQLLFSEKEHTERLQGKQKNHKGIEGHDLSKPKKKDKQNSLKVHDDDGTLDTVIQAKKKKDKNHSKNTKDEIKKKERRRENNPSKSAAKIAQNEQKSEECEQEEETGTWIQCCKKDCGKWRYVAGIEDPILVPAMWECKMNPDKDHNACDSPEVNYDESEHICTKFTIGSLVWAKMDGYPWWPGMIEADPDYDTYFELFTEKSMVPFQYHVTFFDDHVTRAWIRTNNITPYVKDQEPLNKMPKMSKGRNSYQKEIQQAINNAGKALVLSLQDRISTFGFSKRYSKKSKLPMKEKGHKKVNRKLSNKPHNQKNWKETEQCGNTQGEFGHSSDDLSDFNDLSDTLEDSEYKPVKTKSRGSKNSPACEDIQTLEMKSNISEDGSDEDESKSRPDTEARTCANSSTETKLDPDVFTMEIDSNPLAVPKDYTVETDQCCISKSVHNENFALKREKEGDSNALGSIGCKEADVEGTDLTQIEIRSSLNKNKECKANENAQENQQSTHESKKKKKSSKLALKSKLIDKPETQKLTEMHKENDVCEDVSATSGCKDEENVKKEGDGDLKNDNTATACKRERKNGRKHKLVKKGDLNVDSFKDQNQIKKQEKKCKGTKQDRNEIHSNNWNGEKSDDEMTNNETRYAEQIITDSSTSENKKEALESKRTNSSNFDKESDKENMDPSEEMSTAKDKRGGKKKALKRQATADINFNTMDDEVIGASINVDEVKKLKLSASSNENKNSPMKENLKKEEKYGDCKDEAKVRKTDGIKVKKNDKVRTKKVDGEVSKANEVKVMKKDKVKVNKMDEIKVVKEEVKVNRREKVKMSRKDEINVKVSKKKGKSFAAPLKIAKSSDREVPQLFSPCCTKDDTDVAQTRDKLNTNQHVVPDMTQESDTEQILDIDVEPLQFHDMKQGTEKTSYIAEKSTFKDRDDESNNFDSGEEELDLDIDVQKVGPSLPQKFLNDSDDSDASEMDCVSTNNKVKVEKVKGDLKIYGRFAGRCTEHGSDSDPMELIED